MKFQEPTKCDIDRNTIMFLNPLREHGMEGIYNRYDGMNLYDKCWNIHMARRVKYMNASGNIYTKRLL